MGKKLDMVVGGVQVLAAIGVSTLVGGAIVLVKPAKLGAIKKVAVGVAGGVISSMAADVVTTYVEREIHAFVTGVKKVLNREKIKKSIISEEEVEAQA